MAESKEELISLLTEMKQESKKAGLKLNIQNTKIMSSHSITSWQITGEITKIVTDFILGGCQITADGDCSHEIKRHLLLGRIAMTYLDSILKSWDIYFANNGLNNQSHGFSSSPVWTWKLDYKEGWALKNWCFKSVVVGEYSWESLALQGDPSSPS